MTVCKETLKSNLLEESLLLTKLFVGSHTDSFLSENINQKLQGLKVKNLYIYCFRRDFGSKLISTQPVLHCFVSEAPN